MAQGVLIYVIGPPVQHSKGVAILVQEALTSVTERPMNGLTISSITGPVGFLSKWVPGRKGEEGRRHPGMQGLDFWVCRVAWTGTELPLKSFNIMVMDSAFWDLPKAARRQP